MGFCGLIEGDVLQGRCKRSASSKGPSAHFWQPTDMCGTESKLYSWQYSWYHHGQSTTFFFKKKWTLSLKKWTFEKKTKTHGRQILNVDLLVPGWDASRTNLQLILLGHPFEGGREDAIYCNMLPHCSIQNIIFRWNFFGVGKSIKKYLPALSFITEILQQCLQAMGQTQPALLWEE